MLVLEGGGHAGAYGSITAAVVARGGAAIFRDTLRRDFGHDACALAREAEQALRHEIAHHLGDHEAGVAALGR